MFSRLSNSGSLPPSFFHSRLVLLLQNRNGQGAARRVIVIRQRSRRAVQSDDHFHAAEGQYCLEGSLLEDFCCVL